MAGRGYVLAMDTRAAAFSLEKLGHPVRLRIVQILVRAGPQGLPVGALQGVLAIPASTLSHHIAQLVRGELIGQVRDGRNLICTPNYERIEGLVNMLTEKCCTGVSADEPQASASTAA